MRLLILMLLLIVPVSTYASDKTDFQTINFYIEHLNDYVQQRPQYESFRKDILSGKMRKDMPVSLVLLSRKGYTPMGLVRNDAVGDFEFCYKRLLNGKEAIEYFVFENFRLTGYVFKYDGTVRQEI